MIAKNYSSRIANPIYFIKFIAAIIKSDKFSELLSFTIWEIKYFLGMYNKKLIKFNTNDTYTVLSPFSSYKNEQVKISQSNIQWNVMFIKDNKQYGSAIENPNSLLIVKDEKILETYILEESIEALYVSKNEMIFICTLGKIYRLIGKHPELVLEFSSEESCFRQNMAFTEDNNGNLFIGEYGNIWLDKKGWKNIAYIYFSKDNGKTWNKCDFLKRNGINKHIHIIKWCHLNSLLVLTDGDNKKKLWLNKSNNYNTVSKNLINGWFDCTRKHINGGGYTTMVETPDSILFGTDYMGGTNYLAKTNDFINYEKTIIPNPYRKGYFHEMACIGSENNIKLWANIKSSFSGKNKSLLMMSNNLGKSWYRIIEYDGTKINLGILNNSNNNVDKLYIRVCYNDHKSKIITYCIDSINRAN